MSGSLRSLSDNEILFRTHSLSFEERKLTLDLLLHLNEIERRKLHLKSGHASMFVYCTSALRYSESAANRRIRTARCVARFPEALALLQAHEVSLSTVAQVSKILRPDNAATVLNRIRWKSQRQVAAIVAEYEPLAALPPDRVRTVVVPVVSGTASQPSERTEIYRRSGGKELASETPRPPGTVGTGDDASAATAPPSSLSQAIRLERRAMVQFSASEEFMAKLAKVKSLAAHRLRGNTSMEQVLELVIDHFIEDEDPSVRHERREARKQKTGEERSVPQRLTTTSPTRTIPASVRDQVFVRDEQRCAYVSANGKRCGSAHALQVDHIKPIARGGSASLDNLRLLCAQHNRLEAERLMGRSGPRDGLSG